MATVWHELYKVMLPVAGIIVAQGFMSAALSTFLPTFLSSEGASLWRASSAFLVMELAAAVGALSSGTISGRIGRRRVLAFVMIAASLLMWVFLAARRSIIIIVVGAMADVWGLRATFQLSALLGLARLPFVLRLPLRKAG